MKYLPFIALILGGVAAAQEAAVPPKAIPVAPSEPEVNGVESAPSANPAAFSVAQRSYSVSRQFVVVGEDPTLRGAVAMMGDEMRTFLNDLSGDKEEWKTPVVIRIHGLPTDEVPSHPVRYHLTFHEGGWNLNLDLHAGIIQERERVHRVMLTALLYELALRELPPQELGAPLVVPPWLVEGLMETLAWKEKKSDRKLYAALFQHGGLYRLPDLLAVNEADFTNLDGGTRAAFTVASGALVMALSEQPQGKEGFRRFLREVANFGGEMPLLLKRCFPELNLSERSLEKWVALKVAEAKEPPLSDSLSVVETESGLKESLMLHFRDAGGAFVDRPLETGWQDLASLSVARRVEAVRPAQDGLVRLSYRSFPSYRPLIAEYQTILRDVATGKTKTTAAQLAKLAGIRETMLERSKEAADYLDWFEITRAREMSGEFEDYLKLKERLKYQKPKRNDPVSSYLDLMQDAFAPATGSSGSP